MAATRIRNLLFDLGNVIIDIDIDGALQRLKSLMMPSASQTLIDETLIKYETGKISTELFINGLLRHSKPDVQAVDIIEAWNSMLIGIPSYRLDMLEMLRPKYNVYLLSNTNALHVEWLQRHVLQTFGRDDFEKTFFDEVYYSHLIGDRKPNPSVFRHVTQDAILTPALTLFMDDLETNLAPARQLGFATYHVTPEEDIATYLKTEGYF